MSSSKSIVEQETQTETEPEALLGEGAPVATEGIQGGQRYIDTLTSNSEGFAFTAESC